MVNDSQHQDSIDLQLRRVRVDSFPLFLSSRFGYSYGLCGFFGPLHRPSRVASSCYVRPLPRTVDGNPVFVWSCHPGFVPAMTTTMHLPMVRLALDTQLSHFHQNLLVQSCPLNPLGNTEDKRKEGQRVFVLGLPVTLFPFLLWFGLSQLFRRLGRSCFPSGLSPGSHTAHSRFRLGWRREPCALLCRERLPRSWPGSKRSSVSWIYEFGLGNRWAWVCSKTSPLL